MSWATVPYLMEDVRWYDVDVYVRSDDPNT